MPKDQINRKKKRSDQSLAELQKCNPHYNLSSANRHFNGVYYEFSQYTQEKGSEGGFRSSFQLDPKIRLDSKILRHVSEPTPKLSTIPSGFLRKTVSQPLSATSTQNYQSELIPRIIIEDEKKQVEIDNGLRSLFEKSDSPPLHSSFIAGSSYSKEQARLGVVELPVNEDVAPQTISPTGLVKTPEVTYSNPRYGFCFTPGGKVAQDRFTLEDSDCSSSFSSYTFTKFCASQ